MNKVYSLSWLVFSWSLAFGSSGFALCFGFFTSSFFSSFSGLSLLLSSNFFSGFIASIDSANLGGGISKLLLSRLSWGLLAFRLLFLSSSFFGWFVFACGRSLRLSIGIDFSGVSSIRLGSLFGRGICLGHGWDRGGWLVSEELFHLSLLGDKLILGLLKEGNSQFVVHKRDDHIVMERDHIRRNVVVHLLHALHENEGSIGGQSVFSSLGDSPTLLVGVSNGAVIG